MKKFVKMKDQHMQEAWGKWQPINELENKYEIDRIDYTINGDFKILLSEYRDMGKQVTVIFKNGIYAYRETDESFRQYTIYKLSENYKPGFCGSWTFFKVTNSLYIKWLLEESNYMIDPSSLMHFSFVAGNAILDIVATSEPIVEFID